MLCYAMLCTAKGFATDVVLGKNIQHTVLAVHTLIAGLGFSQAPAADYDPSTCVRS